MKKFIVVSLFVLVSIGCSSSAPTQVQTNSAPTPTTSKKDEMTVTSHSTENQKPPMSQSNSGGSGNSPMQKAVDVSAMTANIEKAEKDFKAKPSDAKAKETLATAYFERAFVLTKAAQYRAALGDFRKGLKLKPDDQEAKGMHDQIIDIFKSIGREPPKEGEEPPPVPVEKSK